jgi:hypothetical protein
VAADEIEPKDSGWGKTISTPGIYVLGKRFDRFYEVVVDESYTPWLLYHRFRFLDKAEFEFLFCYDPTQPTKTEVEAYGWGGSMSASSKMHSRRSGPDAARDSSYAFAQSPRQTCKQHLNGLS